MPAPVGPIALTAIGTAVTVPYPSSAAYDTVVLTNASAYVCAVNIGGQQQWLQPFTTDLYPIDPPGVAINVTPTASIGSVTTTALTATFYLASETPAGTYPVPLTALALTAAISGTVNTTVQSLTLGAPVLQAYQSMPTYAGASYQTYTLNPCTGSTTSTPAKIGYLAVSVIVYSISSTGIATLYLPSIGVPAANGWTVGPGNGTITRPSGGWQNVSYTFLAWKIITAQDIAGNAPLTVNQQNTDPSNGQALGSLLMSTFMFGEGTTAWANNQSLTGVQTAPMSWGAYSGSAAISGTAPALYIASISGSYSTPASTYPGQYLSGGPGCPNIWYAGAATGALAMQYTSNPDASSSPPDYAPQGLLVPL